MTDFVTRVAGIGSLADPIRRTLYLYVCAQPDPVGREEASRATGIALHKTKFHLDRLVREGLLVVGYARLSGKQGPGAGRPAKLYRRSDAEVAVTLPERRYELAGRLMASAIAASSTNGRPVRDELLAAAAARGVAIACNHDASGSRSVLEVAQSALTANGYEPRIDECRIVLANCPFHALAAEHTEMICGMNLALIGAMTDEIDRDRLDARLEPEAGRCCVTLRER